MLEGTKTVVNDLAKAGRNLEDFPKGRVAMERHEIGKREYRGIKKIIEKEQGGY